MRNHRAWIACAYLAASWADGPVTAITVSPTTLYLGGLFRNIGGQHRPGDAVFGP